MTADIAVKAARITRTVGVSVGPAGPTGAKGDKGDPGNPGAKGDQGIQGLKGDKGDKGDQGIQGIPGSAQPAWCGAKTRIGVVTSNVPEFVVDRRALTAGILPVDACIRGRMAVSIPVDSTHGQKFMRLGSAADLSHTLLLTLTALQTGLVVIEFELRRGTLTQNSTDTVARYNDKIPYKSAHGICANDFDAGDSNLEAHLWVENQLDQPTVELVEWLYIQPN